jgi:hypothetical protein
MVLVGLLSAACGKVTGPAGGAGASLTPAGVTPHGPTIVVGPDDNGTALSVAVGDAIEFQPDTTATSGLLGWRVFSYPRDLLALTADRGGPPFRFVATDPGAGTLEIMFGPLCGELGPKSGAAADCPLTQAGSTGGPAGIATRIYTYDLTVVVARGA